MARAQAKRSITLDPEVAAMVDELVQDGHAESFSAAMNTAAGRWAKRQLLDRLLDDMDERRGHPPADETLEAAARALRAADEEARGWRR